MSSNSINKKPSNNVYFEKVVMEGDYHYYKLWIIVGNIKMCYNMDINRTKLVFNELLEMLSDE